MKFKKLKTAVSSILISVVIYVIASFMVVMLMHEGIFARVEEYEYDSFMTYGDMGKYYSSREITLNSEGYPLYGRIYDNTDKLVIFGHAKGGSGEDMMAEAKFFLDNGFSAMVFDFFGHGASEGPSQFGLHQAAIDLKNAIEFAKGEGYSEIYLYGIGIGGYAAASCADSEGVKAVASISSFSSVSDMTLEYATEGMSILGYLEYPIMMLYQYLLFGSGLENDAVSGINASDVPAIVINGTEDDTILYDGAALINCADEITNPDVVFRTVENGKHSSLMRSEAARELLDEFNTEAYRLYNEHGGSVPAGEIEAIYASYDREAMSELDTVIMNEVLTVFNSENR